MADRFYTPQLLGPGSFVLDGPEAHHLSTVRRFVAGDRVVLFNGDGKDYPALILLVDKRQILLDVHAGVEVRRESAVSVEVAAAVPKGDRGDFLVEKLVELGAARFTPLVTDRSVVLPKDGRVERWQRAVVEASKQCGRAVLMAVGPAVRWEEFLTRPDLPSDRRVLHPTGANVGIDRPAAGSRVAVAVGPEGGWTEEEVEAARSAGWSAVSLGPRFLRVETAAVAAAALLTVSNPAGPISPTLP